MRGRAIATLAAAAAVAAGWNIARYAARVSPPAPRAPASIRPQPRRADPPRPAVSPPAAAEPVARLRVSERGLCTIHGGRDGARHFLSRADLTRTSERDPDDLLTLVDRSALHGLAPDYAPPDLVSVDTLEPDSRCDVTGRCMRRPAAVALRGLLRAMDRAGAPGHVASAYRPYGVQCDTFQLWAYERGRGFCDATEQSALPGHSQHQLGTAVDLFTRAWAHQGPVFRNDFACTYGGHWIESHAWEYGFVVAYPQHPDYRNARRSCKPRDDVNTTVDPRTGYRYEPWHLRYLGEAAAREFHDALVASGVGSAREITLEQWLRARAGLHGEATLPVCDGCSCGACTTLASDGEAPTPCGESALQLRDDGEPVISPDAPELLAVRVRAHEHTPGRYVIEADLRVPAHAVTQPPTFRDDRTAYEPGSSYRAFAWISRGGQRSYEDLPGAWRLGAGPVRADTTATAAAAETPWPWRASIGDDAVPMYWNGTNLYLPAAPGTRTVTMSVVAPRETQRLRVALLRDGEAHSAVEIALPAR